MLRKICMITVTGSLIFGISNFSFAVMCHDSASQYSLEQIAQSDTEHNREKIDATPQVTIKEAVTVGNEICPVSGEKIDEKTKATHEYEGKIYNFCCAMCIDEFKKDPMKYIKKIENS